MKTFHLEFETYFSYFEISANCLNRIDGPLETTTTNVLATIQKNNPLAAESLTNSLHQSGEISSYIN